MRKRCSIQQGEKNSSWSEHSPEKFECIDCSVSFGPPGIIKNKFYHEYIFPFVLFSELVWLIDYWSGSEVHLYLKEEELERLGTEHCVLVLNHRQDVDWLVTWQVANRKNVLKVSTDCIRCLKALSHWRRRRRDYRDWSVAATFDSGDQK